ncbi:hypothetical protein M3649_19260 [Ureibacillus chungkukjangi]|uniref:DUF7662 domain-containing protein n=1 Tax=Ureibacillus chungkukjangi TaxID=1202712 RepID=UPI00203BFB9B|nr:hypothetical protein [Ureibacillus chungkukjangi]MCM3390240.1 hypothetical protein [Ureibacillus chungkukjangi]
MNRALEGKYNPLHNYLKKSALESVTLTFNEIEDILNISLPQSAYNYQAWWTNSEKAHSHALSWLHAGYLVRDVKFGDYVEFIRNGNIEAEIQNEDTEIKNENSSKLSDGEIEYTQNLSEKMKHVRAVLTDDMVYNFNNKSVVEQYALMKGFRRIIGNIDNDLSFLGCLLIKEFLIERHSCSALNMALKPQGSPGLDIDEKTRDGKRIIGELKTTYPYQENNLGANQKVNFIKDFEKLQQNDADYKYFFVTESKTFEIVRNKYSQYLKGINLVLLPQALTNCNFVIKYS